MEDANLNVQIFHNEGVVNVEKGSPVIVDCPITLYTKGKSLLLAANGNQVLELDETTLKAITTSGNDRVMGLNDGTAMSMTSMTQHHIRPEYGVRAVEGVLEVHAIQRPLMGKKVHKMPEEFEIVKPNSLGKKQTEPELLPVQSLLELDLNGHKLDVEISPAGPQIVVDEHDKIVHPFQQDEKDRHLYSLTVGRGEENGNDYTYPHATAYRGVSRRHAKITVRVLENGALVVVDDLSKGNSVKRRSKEK